MKLYHGTLARHLEAIERDGLVPRIGSFTTKAYGEGAHGVIPAVFMADEAGLERVVHALVAAVIEEITDADFDEYDIGPYHHLNDELFLKYAAICEIEPKDTFQLAGADGENIIDPKQAEDGDWYSLQPVNPSRILKGDELCNFLGDRDIIPSSINQFVDPESCKILDSHKFKM